MALASLLFAGLLNACGPESAPDPQALFSELEERLVSASEVDLAFQVGAEGAISVALEGELRISNDSVALFAVGTFAGETVVLRLEAGTDQMTYGAAGSTDSAERPAHLQEALAVGLTRMGILHNLAMLTAGAPPDRAQGGVREWVTVDGFGLVETPEAAADVLPVSFAMTVDGTPAGTAVLVLKDDHLPLERLQTVQFPEGAMRVIERYTRLTIHP